MSELGSKWRAVEAFSRDDGPAETLRAAMAALASARCRLELFETASGRRAVVAASDSTALEAAGLRYLAPRGSDETAPATVALVLVSAAGDEAALIATASDPAVGEGPVLVGWLGAESAEPPGQEPAATLSIGDEADPIRLYWLGERARAASAKPRVTPLDTKFPEHPDGVSRRADWFRKRHG